MKYLPHAIVIVLIVLFAVFVWPTQYAYEPKEGLSLLRRNRFTGQVEFWMAANPKWRGASQ